MVFNTLCFLMECHQMLWSATESCGIVRTVSIDLLHKLKQSCQRPTLTHDGLTGHEEGLPFIPRRSMVIIQSMRSLRTVPSQVFRQSFFQIRAVEPRVVAFHGPMAPPKVETGPFSSRNAEMLGIQKGKTRRSRSPLIFSSIKKVSIFFRFLPQNVHVTSRATSCMGTCCHLPSKKNKVPQMFSPASHWKCQVSKKTCWISTIFCNPD